MNIFKIHTQVIFNIYCQPCNNSSRHAGLSENKNMTQFSSFQNEVRPGVVVTAIRFSLFPASTSLIFGYRDQI